MIKRCARNYPTKTAYLCGSDARTWREMDERSDRFGAALQSLGHVAGMTVGILTRESITVYEHYFACTKIGAVRVGINNQYAWPEMRHVITDSAIRFLLVDARCAPLLEGHRAELEQLGVRLIGYNGAHDFHYDYETLLAAASSPPLWPALSEDDTVLVSYTSGTTGLPKGVMLTHAGAANHIIHSSGVLGLRPDDIFYVPGASAWIIVMMYMLGLANGMTTVIPDGAFEIRAYLHDVGRFGVTVGLLVPTMLRRAIAEVRSNPVYDLRSLDRMVYGSSPATPRLIREAREVLGVSLIQMYSLTEVTTCVISCLTASDHQYALVHKPDLLKSAGRIAGNYECDIRDEMGNSLPPGEPGEIWLRGNTLMKGYLNLPQATAEVMKDGWLRTNDIGRVDEDGFFYLMDRQKFLIITGAVNVFPSNIEAVMGEHPAIGEIAVVGAPHPEWGEAVVAVIVPSAGHPEVTPEELIAFCRDKLSRPEVPKHVVFVDELPKTANGKVKKADIRKWLSDGAVPLPWSLAEVE
jgi:acyl-CoA synthetase (AMP-forming)/AMP-acid ligase II